MKRLALILVVLVMAMSMSLPAVAEQAEVKTYTVMMPVGSDDPAWEDL